MSVHERNKQPESGDPSVQMIAGLDLPLYGKSPAIEPDPALKSSNKAPTSASRSGSARTPFKETLYVSLMMGDVEDPSLKWDHLDSLGDGGKSCLDDNLKRDLIASILTESNTNCVDHFLAVVDSSIYKVVRGRSINDKDVAVLDTNSRRPLWKKFIPLIEENVRCFGSLRGVIYAVGLSAIHYINPQSSKWVSRRLVLPHTSKMLLIPDFFAVPCEDLNKIAIGGIIEKNYAPEGCEKPFLYLYDLCTYQLDEFDLNGLNIPWYYRLPPASIGNYLFLFYDCVLYAYDVVGRCLWQGSIDQLDHHSFYQICNVLGPKPRLMNVGGDKLGLLCLKSDALEMKSTITCCVFGIPEFIKHGNQKALHGHLDYCRTYNSNYDCYLLDAFVA